MVILLDHAHLLLTHVPDALLRGWHYLLLLLAKLLNTLACYSTGLCALVSARGFRGTLLFLRETHLNPWLRPDRLRALRTRTPQLRLIL